MGLLVVRGTLRVKQFWPDGGSDADTAVVELVLKSKKPFTFVSDTGVRKTTRAFDGAEVIGKYGPRPVIRHDKRLDADVVSVRLQGIDAPELHYQPQVKGSAGHNGKFRQPLGETCSDALHDYLAKLGEDEIPCEVLSRVRKPNDVCDVYARVVGNLVLQIDGARVDINHWLVSEGWATPGLYNSMTKNEIRQLIADHQAAADNGRGIFSGNYLQRKLAPFDPQRKYQAGKPTFKAFSDKGKFNFAKFFRRQAEHHVKRAIALPGVPADFLAFVKSKPDDIAIDVKSFLNHKGPSNETALKKKFKQLGQFVKSGNYPTGPDVVFWEAQSTLVRAGTKKRITNW